MENRMPVDTNVNYDVFGRGFEPVDDSLLENITEEQRQQARAMMLSGHYQCGIYLPMFVREDLTINLEKLEFAVTLAVTMLEANIEDDITLQLRGLEDYYILRKVDKNKKQEREERTFLLGFISSVASEASKRDTLEVKYVR
jgi:hypothetical protein